MPRDVADRPTVRLARLGRGGGLCGGHWPASGLLAHGGVSGVGLYAQASRRCWRLR